MTSGCRNRKEDNTNRGWIAINSPTTDDRYTTDIDMLRLSGTAFVSPTGAYLDYDWTNYHYIGSTGVTVNWKNENTGQVGNASAGFGTCYTGSEYFPLVYLCNTTWSADVPLIMGTNFITVTAGDNSGNEGSASIAITRIIDITPPVVISTNPASGAVEVPGGTSITVMFSEAMDPSSLNGTTFLLYDEGNNRINGTVIASGATTIFTPTVYLAGSRTYRAAITTGAKDRSGGNFLQTAYSWSFTVDSVPPMITRIAPQGFEVELNSSISVEFLEEINYATINATSFIVKDGSNDPVVGPVSYYAKKAMVTPVNSLRNSEVYTAMITTAVADLAGNHLSSDHTWTFYTKAQETGSWQPILPPGDQTYRWNVTTAWTDHELVILGDVISGKYDYVSHTWSTISSAGYPMIAESKAVWTGADVVTWGGYDGTNFLNTGGRYNPASDTWNAVSLVAAPSARNGHTAVWTGYDMINWGGYNGANYLNTGGGYNPVNDTWKAVSLTNAPSARTGQTAVWTGTEMLVWGGYDGSNYLQSGGRYNPINDTWHTISLLGAPLPRNGHSAVWTGTEMIIWGGYNGTNYLSSGARYDPVTDTWHDISLIGAPSPRNRHSAVWSGTEMIIWGGDGANPSHWIFLDSGGLYNPVTNSWRATSRTSVPEARTLHAATWTGAKMIIWGGRDHIYYNNKGGEFTP